MSELAATQAPSTGADPMLDELVDEFAQQLQSGSPVSVAEFAGLHPQYADQLLRVLPAMQLLAELGSPSTDGRLAQDSPEGQSTKSLGTLGDFRILSELGRGGMGVVYEAEQISLGRRVALKVLPFAATLDDKQIQRFKNEAKAAGNLHHANIVAIHFVGRERGVYFYAMQLIEGDTLAQVIADLRLRNADLPKQATVAGAEVLRSPGPPADAGASEHLSPGHAPGLTNLKSTICNLKSSTLSSIHGRAFYHAIARLGMEAARALDYAHEVGIVHRDVKPGNLLVDGSGHLWVTDFGLAQMKGDNNLTMTGDLLGTLRYMSPEQALAKRVLVDHRTDIYSLGATLYEMLTLEPVFASADRQELLRQIAFEEPKPLRRHNKAIPAELQTIVLKALEKNPADRYATAKEMAEDLERFVKDEPIRARRPSLARRGKQWCRRRKPLVAALLSVLLLAGAWSLWGAYQRAATAQAVQNDWTEADTFWKNKQWAKALPALERASGRLVGSGLTSLQAKVDARRRDVAMVARLENTRLSLMLRDDWAGTDRAYGAAFIKYGLEMADVGGEELALRIRASEIRDILVKALDEWAYIKDRVSGTNGDALREFAQLADQDPWRIRLRKLRLSKDRAELERLAEVREAASQPQENVERLVDLLENVGAREAAMRLRRKAQQLNPTDFWLNFNLAIALSKDPTGAAEAVGFYRAALVVQPESPAVYSALGAALAKSGKQTEADEAFKKAIALKPDFAGAYNNLGNAMLDQKKFREAEDALREAIKIKPEAPEPYVNLGNIRFHQEKFREAEDLYRKAIKLKANFPMAWSNLGGVLSVQKKFREAEDADREAIKLQPDLASAHSNLGQALRGQKKFREAEDALREAIKLDTNYAGAYANLGAILHEQRKYPEAEAACRKAIDLEPTAQCFTDLGAILIYQKKFSKAEDALRKVIELDRDSSPGYYNLGIVLAQQHKYPEAEAAYRKAIDLNPENADAHTNLGSALNEQNKLAEAETVSRQAVELAPDDTANYVILGVVLLKQNKLAEAIAAYQKAIDCDPKNSLAYDNLGNALQVQNKLPEAVAAHQKAIDCDPKSASAYYNLGIVLFRQNKPAEAVAAYQKSIELDRNRANTYDNLGLALRTQNKLDEAVAAHQKAIEIDRNHVNAHLNLGLALLGQNKLPEAVKAFRKGIELDPGHTDSWYSLEHVLTLQHKFRETVATYRKFSAFSGSQFDYARLYNAACAAALAGCGQGEDAAKLEPEEYARLRGEALAWLRAGLAAKRRVLEKEPDKAPSVWSEMQHWLIDTDFNGVRGADALAKLPNAERQEWRKLWEEVQELRKKVTPRGFIQNWLVLSELVPYEGEDGAKALDQKTIPREALIHPRAGDRVEVNGKTLVWKEHHSAEPSIDFAALYGSPSEYRLAYAVCYVHADADRSDLALRVGSDDQALLYINGEEVYRQTKARELKLDEDEVRPIRLRKGANILVFKVVNQSGPGPYGSLHLVTKDGAEPEGIAYRLTP